MSGASGRVRRVRPRLPAAVRGVAAVLGLLPRISVGRTVLLTVCVVLSAALPVAMIVAAGWLVGTIPAAVRGGLGSTAGRTTTTLLMLIGALVIAQRLLGPIMVATASTLGRELDRYLQERALDAVGGPTGIAHLEDPDVLDQVRIVRGLGAGTHRPGLAVTALPNVVPAWLRALGSSAVLLAFHWWLGLLWLVMWPVVAYVTQRLYLRIAQVAFRQSGALRRAEYLRDLALTPPAAKEVRLWGMLDWLVAKYDSAWIDAMRPVWAERKPRPAVVFGAGGIVLLVNLLSYGLLAWAAIRGDLTLGALAVFVQALAGANAFGLLDDDIGNLVAAAVTVPKVLDLHERTRSAEPAAGPTTALSARAPSTAIRFEDVTFRYPGAATNALTNLDLSIPAGRSLAIVGPNGAGKTSLVKLLCRFYEPSAGQIIVDGTDLTQLDPEDWRRHIAALFQDFNRYQLSVRDNIAFGAAHTHDGDLIRTAARQASVTEVIERLPHGWDTVLSRQYSNGSDLSGGQWQRIALARALYAINAGARILILDEPTAALDIRAEAQLYDTLLNLRLDEELTTILISHRFSTVRHADHIIVLADGGITEQGSHDQLLARGGQYAHMYALQTEHLDLDDDGADEHV